MLDSSSNLIRSGETGLSAGLQGQSEYLKAWVGCSNFTQKLAKSATNFKNSLCITDFQGYLKGVLFVLYEAFNIILLIQIDKSNIV